MKNPFKQSLMRLEYEGAIKAHAAKHKALFLPNGERRTQGHFGSSFATFFWRGYDGVIPGGSQGWDRDSKRMLGYALWCAGRDVRKAEAATLPKEPSS